ncbi:MAG: hypothetical protein P8P83_00135 [Rickettsiaceae bacterium]|nr:hypothetical protein [Rickettsiaceae bacterium]
MPQNSTTEDSSSDAINDNIKTCLQVLRISIDEFIQMKKNDPEPRALEATLIFLACLSAATSSNISATSINSAEPIEENDVIELGSSDNSE